MSKLEEMIRRANKAGFLVEFNPTEVRPGVRALAVIYQGVDVNEYSSTRREYDCEQEADLVKAMESCMSLVERYENE